MSEERIECLVCFSTRIYRAGRCQGHYRHRLRYGHDAKLTMEQLCRSLEREQARSLRRPA